VRPWNAPDDPAEILAAGGAESQFLYDRRQAAIAPLAALRSAAQGISALISAGLEFVPHQIAAVRRILADPIQRYLLADEVGLGKTIEAGLVVRQHLIDDPDAKILVAVPSQLRGQWESELLHKLRLDQFGNSFKLYSHEDLRWAVGAPDVLIVDEAHHLVGLVDGPQVGSACKLKELSQTSKVLLLLSATPALSDPHRFLALLNLLDPLNHPLDDIAGFKLKLANRREFGRLLLSLDSTGPGLVLRQRSAEALRLFPEDPIVGDLAPRLIEASRSGSEELHSLCNALRIHIADSYRLHQRLIRSRRADAKGWEFMPRGPIVEGSPDLAHVRQEVDTDDRMAELQSCLEEWRYTALESTDPSDRQRIVALAFRYRTLIEALGVDLSTFAEAVNSEGPSFDGERELNDVLLTIAARDGTTDARLAVMVESTARLLKTLSGSTQHPKIVAFSSSTKTARDFNRALLTEGFLIFNRSISDVQFLLDEIEKDFAVTLFCEGPASAVAMVADIRLRIESERRSQDEQSALDQIALAEEPVERFIEGLDAAEEDEGVLETGIEKWLVGVLQLSRHSLSRPERDPFSFGISSHTLVPPVPWLAAFGIDASKPLTWRRRIASARSDVTLLRPGTPLIDAIERYTRWDDRHDDASHRVQPHFRRLDTLKHGLCDREVLQGRGISGCRSTKISTQRI
jgi:ATP-dependent helicase HepA